jgi:hypothetical protein
MEQKTFTAYEFFSEVNTLLPWDEIVNKALSSTADTERSTEYAKTLQVAQLYFLYIWYNTTPDIIIDLINKQQLLQQFLAYNPMGNERLTSVNYLATLQEIKQKKLHVYWNKIAKKTLKQATLAITPAIVKEGEQYIVIQDPTLWDNQRTWIQSVRWAVLATIPCVFLTFYSIGAYNWHQHNIDIAIEPQDKHIEELTKQLHTFEADIDTQAEQIDKLEAELGLLSKTNPTQHNVKLSTFNTLIEQYNADVKQFTIRTESLKTQTSKRNTLLLQMQAEPFFIPYGKHIWQKWFNT